MSYATPTDLIARFGEREARALADRLGTGEIDESVLQRALDEASSEMDGYLGVRYALPLPTLSQSATALVRNICLDVTRYRLVGTETMNTDEIESRYKLAIKQLEALRDGKLFIGDISLKPAGGDVNTAGNNAVRVRQQVFSENALGGY
jgi:phage gp36-like protein